MSSYPYLNDRNKWYNPHPIISIEISACYDPNRKIETLALVDSGADETLLPIKIIQDSTLELNPIGEVTLIGVTGKGVYNTYCVNIRVEGVIFRHLFVAGIPNLDYPLIGRDILNKFFIHLNGPSEILTV